MYPSFTGVLASMPAARAACRAPSIALLLGLLLAVGQVQAALQGTPPHVRFVNEASPDNQYFGIVRDARGVVYVGSDRGVTEFDGERWELLALGNGEIGRTLAVDGDRVFVGGYNEFGELALQPGGGREFRSLRQPFAAHLGEREFADIWDVVVAPEGIYFRALRDLFLWDPGSGVARHWHHEGRFGALAHRDGETWLQFRGEGFRRLVDGDWQPVPGTGHLTELVYRLLPLPEGGWLSLGSDGDWWRIDGGAVSPASMPGGMPASSQFEHATVLHDGSLAFASREGAVHFVAPDRRRHVAVRIDSSFLLGIHAIPGGLLVSGGEGFHHLSWPSPLEVIGEREGIAGSLYGVVEWRGEQLLLGSAGALRAEDGSARHVLADWSAASIHDLLPLDGRRALVAAAHRLMLLEDERLSDLSPELIYPRGFHRSARDPQRIYLATESGLRWLTLDGRAVRVDTPEPTGTAVRIIQVVEREDAVWVGTYRHGVWRYPMLADGRLQAGEEVGEAMGLRHEGLASGGVFVWPDGRLGASTGAGQFVFEEGRFVEHAAGNLPELRRPGEHLDLAFSPQGSAWAYSDQRLLHAADGETWMELPLRGLRRGGISAHRIGADGELLLVSSGALVIHRPDLSTAAPPPPRVQLRGVTQIDADGRRHALPLRADGPPRLPAGDFAIEFRFALADLGRAGRRQYQGRLLGYESAWSDWSESHSYTYSRLRPGDYRLELRALDASGRVSEIDPYALVIEPPWYATGSARLLAAAAAALLLWALVRVVVQHRTHRLSVDKQRLESTVAERTRELAEANRRLEQMAHVDGLTGVSNRRRLDTYLQSVWVQCDARGRPLSLLAIDVDRFKDYNDQHGHLAGDEVLRRLSRRLSRCLRRTEDMLARFGGEEFMVVLPGAAVEVAERLAEVMRSEIEEAAIGVTVSIGVACAIPDEAGRVEALVQRADAALYRAKSAGRNRVEVDGGVA